MKAKRTAFAEFQICDLPELDLEALERDEVVEIRKPGILGFSALVPAHHRLTRADVDLLANLSDREWADVVDQVDQVEDLARHGFLVVDVDEQPFTEYRERDEAYTAGAWAPEAACYHFTTEDRYVYKQPKDYDAARANSVANFTQHAEKHGLPPPAFWEPDGVGEWSPLPLNRPEGQLYEALRDRRSVRTYSDRSLTAEQLGTLLYQVWGCHGTNDLAPGIPVLRKTSPSGGSMHPTEVYALIRDVDGIAPGIYHYSSERHALGLIERMAASQLAQLAIDCSHGQLWLASAPVSFIMTTRYTRHLWKYRNISRAYTVMLMDAAHLSQTCYLVATQLGLGACFTGALHAPTIESRLRLDGVTQGPAGIIGCGYAARQPFPAEPYTPTSSTTSQPAG